MKPRHALLALIALAAAVSAQQPKMPPTARIPAPSPHAAPGVSFTDVTKAAGLSDFRFVAGTPAKDYIIEATGAGVGFVDYDDDGWLDVYLINGGTLDALRGKAKMPRAALFRNHRDGTFTDVTAKAGVANERWGQGVCAGDFDNDGRQDIYVTNFGANRLYRNNGDGTFTDVAERAGVTAGGWTTGCAFGDYDGDGRLDLFVAGYVDLDINNLPPPASGNGGTREGEKGREQATAGMGATFKAGVKYCVYRGQRVMCGPRGLQGARDYLFHNNGDGTFSDVTERAGVADKAGYYGFGVAWFDADDDGRLDLVVANDSTPNYLYRNKGDGTFEDISYTSGLALNEDGREQACMGVAVGDYDGDGRADVFMTNFADDTNVLYRNDGAGNFTDVTARAGVGEISIPFLGWGANFFDYDNDGRLDLLVANGHVYPSVDAAEMNTSYRQRLLLLRNVRNRFHDVGASAGAALYQLRSARGSAIGDYDNDGDQDILLGNLDDAPTLLRNDGAHKKSHWLTVKLIGELKSKTPRDAVGSVVFCTIGGRRLRGEVTSGAGYHSQSDLRVHFGLGAATRVDGLEVRWAGGKAERHVIKGVDRLVTIEKK